MTKVVFSLVGLLVAPRGVFATEADALPVGAVWLEPAAVHARLAQGEPLVLVYCRARGEFQARHIVGAQSVPRDEVEGAAFPRDRWLVLYCGGEGCGVSLQAARALLGRGYRQVAVLRGGLLAWVAAGMALAGGEDTSGRPGGRPYAHPPAAVPGRVAAISVGELAQLLQGATAVYLADVRQAAEYAAGHVSGAHLHPNGAGLGPAVPAVVIVTYDRVGVTARVVAEQAAAERGGEVRYLEGGMAQWQRRGYPVVTK